MRLSNQAIGSIMMALQRAILKQEDVTQILREFELGVEKENNEVVVTNPPTVEAEPEQEDVSDS